MLVKTNGRCCTTSHVILSWFTIARGEKTHLEILSQENGWIGLEGTPKHFANHMPRSLFQQEKWLLSIIRYVGWWPCLQRGSCSLIVLEVPPNPSHSMILWPELSVCSISNPEELKSYFITACKGLLVYFLPLTKVYAILIPKALKVLDARNCY